MKLQDLHKRRLLSIAGGGLLVALLAACDGVDGNESKDAGSEPTAAATTSSNGSSSTPVVGATSPASSITPTATTSPNGSSSTPVVGATSSAISITPIDYEGLDSYKYRIKFSGQGGRSALWLQATASNASSVEVIGAYIKPDRAESMFKYPGEIRGAS